MFSACNPLADDIIAIQREVIAQRVLQKKGLASTSVPSSKALTGNKHSLGPSRKVAQGQCHLQSIPRKLNHQDILTKAVLPRPPSSPFKKGRPQDIDDRSVSTVTITATTQEPAQPLQLPTFKPSVGCISAADFLVRCFVARLKKGVPVIKHSRSIFTKSPRPYILTLDVDRKHLAWLPASAGEDWELSKLVKNPCTSTPLRRVNLLECQEVRMALTPDPENPCFTGSATLREKCDPADAHKSFALIFENRTLDITAMTADQCKMLTEGFSALCYRLHLKKFQKQFHVEQRPKEAKGVGCRWV